MLNNLLKDCVPAVIGNKDISKERRIRLNLLKKVSKIQKMIRLKQKFQNLKNHRTQTADIRTKNMRQKGCAKVATKKPEENRERNN